MSIYVDSFEDDSFEVVIDEKEGLTVELKNNITTWSEISGDITKNKSVVKFLSKLPMLPEIPLEGKHIAKAVEGEAVWEEDNLATKDELALAKDEIALTKEELQAGIDTKQDKGDYATNKVLNAIKEELQDSINTKQDRGNYALKSELPTTSHLATKTELANVNKILTTSVTNIENTKQDKGDYAVKSDLTSLATKDNLYNTSQALQKNIDSKQDKGNYALREEIPDVSGYVTKSLYEQTNETFQNALNNKQAKGDYVTNTELNNKGFLTNYTETDPVYLADKPNLALKSELPDLTTYATKESVNTGLNTKQDKGDYALKEEIPSLEGYVKDTDIATSEKAGIAKINLAYGININNQNLTVLRASDNEVKGKNNLYRPIVPANLDLAVKTGVTTNTIELTADEKAKAKNWLGYATPTDIMQAIASIPQFKMSIVDELPLAGEKMTLYLVPKEGTNNDVYDEYIWIEQTASFEHLGTTAVDLTDYVKNTDYATADKAGLIRPIQDFGLRINTNTGYIYPMVITLEQYLNKTESFFISKGTLENIKNNYVKEAITANDIELTDDEKTSARTWLGAVGDTDYATGTKGGVCKTSAYYGVSVNNSGFLLASSVTLDAYKTGDKALFVAKGTLDNVLTQYSKTVLTTEADYEALETKDANTLYLIEE